MSGIYKSRLFNFLNRQRIRFSNQLGITLRHLQLTTKTGVQILLYPIYRITKASIPVKQKLNSQATSSQKFELTAESDNQSSTTQIKVSTKKISPTESSEKKSLGIKVFIRKAIAYFLGNKQQSLSGKNQAALPSWQSSESTIIQSAPTNLLVTNSTKADKSQLSLLSQVGSWLSKTKSNIVRPNSLTTESSAQDSWGIEILIRKAIAYFFGNKQQSLSGKNQAALPSWQSSESTIIQSAPTNFLVTNSPKADKSQLSLFSQVGSWLGKAKSNIVRPNSLTTESSAQDSWGIEILIRKAIAYFLGKKQQSLSGKNQETLKSLQSSESTIIQSAPTNFLVKNSTKADKSQLSLLSQVGYWLGKSKSNIVRPHSLTIESSAQDSWGIEILIRKAIAYFFSHKQVTISNTINSNYSITLPFSTFTIPSESKKLSVTLPFQSWNLKLPNSSLTQNNHSSIIKANSPALKTIPNNMDGLCPFINNNLFSECNQYSSYLDNTANFSLASNKEQKTLTSIPLEFSADFWEAEVITVGYVKNILEIILEFLDKITWLIEKQLLIVWQFLKKLLVN